MLNVKKLVLSKVIKKRIEWNEINSENGSNLMKEKIDKFLEFYNKL